MPRSIVLHGTHFIPARVSDEIMSMLDGVLLRSELANEQIVENAQLSSISAPTTVRRTYEHQASAFESDAG